MPFPFRRKSSDLVTDAVAEANAPSSDPAADDRKGHTPSKRELGQTTPKRARNARRAAEPPPSNRREAYRRMRERTRTEREERKQAMASGDARFMLKRDRGPTRALVRDIVDYRLTVGTWFFAGALIVLVGSNAMMPLEIRFASNILWILLATATIIDSILLCRKIKTLVRERLPETEEKMGSLYFYGVMRGITFRRMRMPRPRIKLGESF
ncbi:MAG: DUF3043 domain-containing protein [Dactylosporangium sp.]|nr:DUF3043 domain-containing protein [Dactylosporangium sp.]NNJ61848.1 DUF3043 domain-containing protein [Dactylosporangium sp.]